MMKCTLTIAALAAALAVPAVAQQPTPNPTPSQQTATGGQQAGFLGQQAATEWRGSKLIGASVYGPDNSSIGEISELIISREGQTKAVIIGVGGFLGVGQKDVAVPFESLSVKHRPDSGSLDKVTTSYSKDQLMNAPSFAYYEPPAGSRQTTGSGSGTGSPRPSGTPMNR